MNWTGYTSLKNIIDKQVKDNNHRDPLPPGVFKFYPSSCGKCARAVFYQIKGFKSAGMDARIHHILDNGNYFHSRMEKILEDTKLMIAPELAIKAPLLHISGRSDAIITNFHEHTSSNNIITLYKPQKKKDEDAGKDKEILWQGPDNDILIIEFKSISDSGFNYVSKKGAKEEHIAQLQLYMHLTGIRAGYVYYENKNTQAQLEYYVDYDEALAQQIVGKIQFIIQSVKDNTLPPREYDRVDFACQFCDYASECWPEDSDNIEKIIERLVEDGL